MKKEVIDRLKEASNFFKHADRDSGEVLEFNPETTELWLWDACILYQTMSGDKTNYMDCYLIWFAIRHPDLFEQNVAHEFLKSLKNTFSTRLEFINTYFEAIHRQPQF